MRCYAKMRLPIKCPSFPQKTRFVGSVLFDFIQILLQVTLSYYFGRNRKNVVTIPADQAAFNETVDPTRMLSLHCLNIPDDDICPHR